MLPGDGASPNAGGRRCVGERMYVGSETDFPYGGQGCELLDTCMGISAAGPAVH